MKNNLAFNLLNKHKNNYYVYVFLDPIKPGIYSYKGIKFEYEPFYIGKGVENRINDSNRSFKVHKNTIRRKIFEHLTERQALKKESFLIKSIGTTVLKNGPLKNIQLNTGHKNIVRKRKKIKEKQKLQLIQYNKAKDELAQFINSIAK